MSVVPKRVLLPLFYFDDLRFPFSSQEDKKFQRRVTLTRREGREKVRHHLSD